MLEAIIQHIDIFITAIVTLFGSGIFFYRENKSKLKVEVSQKEVEVINSSNDGWKDLYNRVIERNAVLSNENIKLSEENQKLLKQNSALSMRYQEAIWYRCEVNGCIDRIPPRKIDDMVQK